MRRGIRYEYTKDISEKPHPAHLQKVRTKPAEVIRVNSDTFRIILKEGKNRQIRRMVQACGHQVKRLKRIRIEHIELRDMPE